MKRVLLLLTLALLAVLLWRQAQPDGRVEQVSQPPTERQRYVAATVEIICLGRTTHDPHAVASETWQIYRRHQFVPVMKYLDLVVRYEDDFAIRAEIERQVASCDGTASYP